HAPATGHSHHRTAGEELEGRARDGAHPRHPGASLSRALGVRPESDRRIPPELLKMGKRGLAWLLLGLLAVYALQKSAAGRLPEMLWGCHLASLVVATSILLERPRGRAVGFLFYVAVGLPAWLLDLYAS